MLALQFIQLSTCIDLATTILIGSAGRSLQVLFASMQSTNGRDLGIAIAVIRPPETYSIIKDRSGAVYFRCEPL